MSTKRIRIVVTINADGKVDVRHDNYRDEFKTIRSSRQLMDEVYADVPFHTVIVEADIPLPEVATVAGTVEKVGAA